VSRGPASAGSLGVRYSEQFAAALFQEVLGMEESTTYQGIVRRAQAREARRILLRLGRKHLGPPDEAIVAVIEGITDVERLETLTEQAEEAESWQQLLAPSARGRRRRTP
jgi:hypothetical protein